MKTQKVVLNFLTVFMIVEFVACAIDKSPLAIEAEKCWNRKTTIHDYEY